MSVILIESNKQIDSKDSRYLLLIHRVFYDPFILRFHSYIALHVSDIRGNVLKCKTVTMINIRSFILENCLN